MAELVKNCARSIKKEVEVGYRVSVARIYFGIQYGAQLPSHISRIVGTVTHVYSNNACKVLWDVFTCLKLL